MSEDDSYRQSIQKQLAKLEESINIDAILDHLFQEKVINREQLEQLEAYKMHEGHTFAVRTLLQLVIGKHVSVKQFMKVVGQQLRWVREMIEGGAEV